jgi:hypothetical protein
MDVLLKFTTNWIIPVIFFLAVFSFLTMIIVELLDARLQFKSRLLDRAIRHILGTRLRDRFFNNIIVNPLSESKSPAYISERTFATIVMHWLVLDHGFPGKRFDEHPGEAIKEVIKSLTKEAPIVAGLLEYLLEQAYIQNIESSRFYDYFEEEIAQWFGHALDRVSSQYKALAGTELMLVGIFVAVLANFDVINMVASLWKAALIKELADLYDKAGQPLSGIDTSLFTTLPLGWHATDWKTLFTSPIALVLKITGLSLGGFLIFVCAQYIYDYVKKQANPGRASTESAESKDEYYISKG